MLQLYPWHTKHCLAGWLFLLIGRENIWSVIPLWFWQFCSPDLQYRGIEQYVGQISICFYSRIFWNLIGQNLRVQKVMSQRSTCLCTHANAFSNVEGDLCRKKPHKVSKSRRWWWNKSLIRMIISWLLGGQVLPDQLAAGIWSPWKPTLPNIRILFDGDEEPTKNQMIFFCKFSQKIILILLY